MNTDPKYLTLHVLTTLPWHNLNRDERGMPKTLTQGGVPRGMLSAQSLKRAARIDYEKNAHDVSYRSAGHAYKLVADRIAAVLANTGAAPLDQTKVLKASKEAVDALVKAEKAAKAPKGAGTETDDAPANDKDTNVWLSDDEVDLLAHAVIDVLTNGSPPREASAVVGVDRQVASLAIAAFGRMFANAPHRQTVAAIAVSPATTVHQIVFETDYFTTVDDLNEVYALATQQKGASYLDSAHYTTGIYYRAITIDKEQLRRSWSSFADADADATARVRALVRSLVMALPSGKQSSTAPYTKPLLVLAEEQLGRTAYEFETPVQPDAEGGYKASSVQALLDQRAEAVAFDPAGFGKATAAGTASKSAEFADDVVVGNLETVIDHVIEWLSQ